MYDVFISHASEDKASVARPVAFELLKRGYSVFLDELVIKLGDSLSESINQGLLESRYCILILSNAFLTKNWTIAELNSIYSIQINLHQKKILPIWHNITFEDIRKNTPLLADLYAINTEIGISMIADKIVEAIGQPANDKKTTNYNWKFEDFSKPMKKHILNCICTLDVDLYDYYNVLLEIQDFLEIIENEETDNEILNIIYARKKEIAELIQRDEEDMWNDSCSSY